MATIAVCVYAMAGAINATRKLVKDMLRKLRAARLVARRTWASVDGLVRGEYDGFDRALLEMRRP